MYPAEELKKLELRKLHARLSILKHRQQCIMAGRQINETAENIEVWRQRAMQWGGMLKFAPGVLGIFHGLRGLFGHRSTRAAAAAEVDGESMPKKSGKVATAINWLTTGLKAYNTFKRR